MIGMHYCNNAIPHRIICCWFVWESKITLDSSKLIGQQNITITNHNIFSSQDEARKAVENALGWKKTGLPKLGMRIERRQQRLPPSAGGGGWSGGGGWFRWFSSGGFWDAAKQTLLTIVGIIAAVKTINILHFLYEWVVNLDVFLTAVQFLCSFSWLQTSMCW